MTHPSHASFKKHFTSLNCPIPNWHFVLGSGFGNALDLITEKCGLKKIGEIPFHSIESLPGSGAPGHRGAFHFYSRKNDTYIFQMGRIHGYEGHSAQTAVLPVMLSRHIGVQNFFLTNAAGGLKKEFKTGSVMLIEDHLNFTGMNPLVGHNPVSPVNGKEFGPRFPDLSHLYDHSFYKSLEPCLKQQGLDVHRGNYIGLLGPSFETPAEVRLFGQWGIGAVGMSTVWEAIALKHSGATVAGLSLISNPGAGLFPNETIDHGNILEACKATAEKVFLALMETLASGK